MKGEDQKPWQKQCRIGVIAMRFEKRNGSLKFVLMLVLTLCVCGTAVAQDVKYNYMPGTDFSKYKTYKWVSEDNVHPNQIVDQQIKIAIDQQLASKGLTKTDSDKADLYIGYQVSIDQEKQWNAYGGGVGWRMGGMASATSTTIQNGTLILDIYDPATKQLVWRGTATKTLNPSNNPDKNQQNLNKAMAKLLKPFPPTPKK